MRHYFYLTILLFFVISCEKTKENSVTGLTDQGLSPIKLNLQDSIPLFNDSVFFSSFNFRSVHFGKVFGSAYPGLNLSAVDLKSVGKIDFISSYGEGPGEFQNKIETILAPNGDIYVLEQFNKSRLVIFDSSYQYKSTINLTNHIVGYYPKSSKSYFQVRALDENTNRIYFALSSTELSRSDKDYYDLYSIVELDIDIHSFEVKNVELKLRYNDITPVKGFVTSRKRVWNYIQPIFSVEEEHIFVYYPGTEVIFEFDFSWNLLNEYPIYYEYPSYKYSADFNDIEGTVERLYLENKLLYGNYNITYIDSKSNLIFFTYKKPISPETISEDFMVVPQTDRILHIIDRNSGRQYSQLLKGNIKFGSIFQVNQNTISFLGRDQNSEEDYYLYNYHYELH